MWVLRDQASESNAQLSGMMSSAGFDGGSLEEQLHGLLVAHKEAQEALQGAPRQPGQGGLAVGGALRDLEEQLEALREECRTLEVRRPRGSFSSSFCSSSRGSSLVLVLLGRQHLGAPWS